MKSINGSNFGSWVVWKSMIFGGMLGGWMDGKRRMVERNWMNGGWWRKSGRRWRKSGRGGWMGVGCGRKAQKGSVVVGTQDGVVPEVEAVAYAEAARGGGCEEDEWWKM